MSNSIQIIRNVYDIAKNSRDNDKPMNDDEIKALLKRLLPEDALALNYKRFEKGYAAEDLFRRIFSLLPWVKSIVPLGQEQFPEKSKQDLQVADYEISFEAGDKNTIANVLVEVKLVDGEKRTFELQKYKFDVLNKYSKQKNEILLFGIFWRKSALWTVNAIDSFSEKSSSYKISFDDAIRNDLSAVFGDYTYVFRKRCFRKSIFSNMNNSEYVHSHKNYGFTIYDGISLDKISFDKLSVFETPVLDCAFDFKERSVETDADKNTVLMEELILDKDMYVYKLSSLILAYLRKIFCYESDGMFYRDNIVVEKAFDIVDTVRNKCGGERFYLIPHKITPISTKVMELQFGGVRQIIKAYKETDRDERNLLVN